jgi:Fe-S oxidoreductase
MSGLAEMCSGIGQCRQRLVGTMCPSYMATGDETHTTRARANALRMALSNRGLLDGLADPALKEVFDLCLNCKACKTECPTGTDVGKLKTEWLGYRNRTLGASRRARMVADSVGMAKWGNRFAPLSNWVMQNSVVRAFMEKRYGFDRRVPPPRFASHTFRQWWRREGIAGANADAPAGPVLLYVDTWTNHYLPQLGVAAVKVLRALGYGVVVTRHGCCGRPMISQGLLPEAKLLAERNIDALFRFAAEGVPIVGIEPSCVSAMVDEWPQFVRDHRARRVADAARTVEAFVAKALVGRPEGAANPFDAARLGKILYHGHCHQKAMFGTGDAMAALQAATGGCASEINSGCCGMAGSFGHEHEHYDVAKACGEQRLFPAIRNRGEAGIAVSGFSCRHQIEHHTGVHARHVVEVLADAVDGGARG